MIEAEQSPGTSVEEALPRVSPHQRERLLTDLLRRVSRSFYLTLRVLPDNGSGSRREDRYDYFVVGPQEGYLQSRSVDDDGFALTTTYEYDLIGNMTRTIDPRGHDTQYVVNQLNQIVVRTSREVTDGKRRGHRLGHAVCVCAALWR